MRVTVRQKLLAHPSVFRLSDFHLLQGDLVIARENFGATLNKVTLPTADILSYSLACSALIHYRKAFDQKGHRRVFLTDKAVRKTAVELLPLHEHLLNLSNKYVAHSENEYEQCLATISVAEDDAGNATFRGLGFQASGIALLSQDHSERSIVLIDRLIEGYLLPEMGRLEAEIRAICEALSSQDLKNLPDGLAPVSSSNPQTKRSWPHSGKY
jgi:hypothetical protein